jgi:hypothetical protein
VVRAHPEIDAANDFMSKTHITTELCWRKLELIDRREIRDERVWWERMLAHCQRREYVPPQYQTSTALSFTPARAGLRPGAGREVAGRGEGTRATA